MNLIIISLRAKAKKLARIYVVCFLVIAAIFPTIAILKRDPRMSSSDSTKRFLVKACAENDEVAINQLTMERGFSTLRKAMKHYNFTTYAQMSGVVARFMDMNGSATIGFAVIYTEFSTSSDQNDPDLAYRCDIHGCKLDNVGPYWRDTIQPCITDGCF